MDHYFHKNLLLIVSLLLLVSISTIATESPTSSPSAAPESSPPNLKSESPNPQPESSSSSSASPNLQPDSSSSSSASPNLQPESSSSSSASPNLQPESSSSGSPSQSPAFPPSSHVSFPPSGSDAPSPSMSSSSELDSPDSPDANRNTEPEDSPDSYVPEEETPEGPDGEIPSSVPSSSSKSESESDSDSSDPPLKEEITDKNANPEVKKACGSTDYPNLCINTLDPIISPKKEVTLDTVLKVSIKATNDLAKAAKVMATKLAAAPGTPPELTKVLNDCKESYDSALYNFERAMEAYDTHDVGTMNTMLSAVITDVGDCEDEFSAVNIPSPVAEFAQKLANMTSNCLAIVSLLQY